MKLRALLELCRISNLPTVWSNAVLGVFAGTLIFGDPSHELWGVTLQIAWGFAAVFALAMSLIYCGGMVLNDYVDRDIDRIERPQRPIPSGRVKPIAARNLAWLMMISGALLVIVPEMIIRIDIGKRIVPEASIAVLLLLILVVLYNKTHQATAKSVVFMAMCRSMIVISGVLSSSEWLPLLSIPDKLIYVIGPASTLFIYTLAISVVARREIEPGVFGGPRVVMNMIAAMPLLDAIWLVVMGLWPASLFCVACAGLTKLAHRQVAGS